MADAWPSPAIFEAGAPPRSRRYGDVYFSKEGGLAQARAVFLEGCGLPEGWRGRRRFVVAELGFGTGLNIAALLQAWSASRTDGAHLSIFSVEAEPLPPDEAKRALSAWPELAGEAEALLAAWPGRRRGFHRVDLPGHGATLDVAVMEAEAALEAWSGRADAWFLDGFSPALNSAMWTGALMRLVAQRSAPGARAATYSVAGQVRGALEEAGFSLERRPGFGAKRQRLEARLPGDAAAETLAPRVTIVGAGIAGASLARAYRALGCEVRVLERAAPGAGASGNPSALVTPRLDAGAESIARLHAQALDRAVRLYEREPGVVLARGVLQFEAGARDHSRFARIAASDVFGPGALAQLSAEEVGAALGEPAPPALALETALAVRPAAILETWLAEVEQAEVAAMELAGAVWRLLGDDGRVIAEADVVCLATGADLPALLAGAEVTPVRGQLSWASGVRSPAAAWGAYVAPTPDGLAFGATYDRERIDETWRAEDDARNLASLAARLPALASRLAGARVEGRASRRATTPDRLPLAGLVKPGLAVLGGLGARGFALAPLLAEHLAALTLGLPSPLPDSLARIVSPARFQMRRARLSPGRAPL